MHKLPCISVPRVALAVSGYMGPSPPPLPPPLPACPVHFLPFLLFHLGCWSANLARRPPSTELGVLSIVLVCLVLGRARLEYLCSRGSSALGHSFSLLTLVCALRFHLFSPPWSCAPPPPLAPSPGCPLGHPAGWLVSYGFHRSLAAFRGSCAFKHRK